MSNAIKKLREAGAVQVVFSHDLLLAMFEEWLRQHRCELFVIPHAADDLPTFGTRAAHDASGEETNK